jgi:hypothetical protein
MPAGLTVALVMLAPAAGPVPTPQAPSAQQTVGADDGDCAEANHDPNSREIVVCAPKPQGYRLNPDVLEAKREMKSGGRPKSQQERMQPPNQCAVGPAPCQYAGINLIAAAVTAAEMAQRIARGQEVGSMFQTDPHPTEYQLYLEAKNRREAMEAEARAKSVQAKAQAQAASPAQGSEPERAAKR